MDQLPQLPASQGTVEEVWPENAQWPDGTDFNSTEIKWMYGSKGGEFDQLEPGRLPHTYYFGTELEILFRPRGEFLQAGQAISHLAGVLRDGGVRHLLLDDNELHRLSSENKIIPYRQWLLTSDASLGRRNGYNIWGIEIISAVHCGDSQVWYDEFRLLWRCLLENFELQQSTKCGTHIHISTFPQFTSPKPCTALRRLAQAIIYFERCIDALMPPQRLSEDHYCKSNRWNPKLRHYDVKQIFKMIDRAQTLEELTELMCYDEKLGSSKRFKWNFIPLKDFKGTIEFRQPPGSTTQEDALVWTSFAQAFVKGAMETFWFRKGYEIDGVVWELPHPPTIKHLEMMLATRRNYDGVSQLLVNASQLEELTLEAVVAAELTSTTKSNRALPDSVRDPAEQQAYDDMKWNRCLAALQGLSLEE